MASASSHPRRFGESDNPKVKDFKRDREWAAIRDLMAQLDEDQAIEDAGIGGWGWAQVSDAG